MNTILKTALAAALSLGVFASASAAYNRPTGVVENYASYGRPEGSNNVVTASYGRPEGSNNVVTASYGRPEGSNNVVTASYGRPEGSNNVVTA